MSNRSYANARKREQNKPIIEQFCNDHGFSFEYLAGDWHIRIEGVFDVYPTRKRYFWLPTKEWGSWRDYDDLGTIMLEHMKK